MLTRVRERMREGFMGPNFDCAISTLLCDEIDFEYETDEVQNPFIDLPLQSEECLELLIKRECEYFPNSDYLSRLRNGGLDLKDRKEAIVWIRKVQSHYNFGPLCATLAVNYLDRYLSAHESPKGKPWSMQLLAVACLSIAAKMEETYVPLCLDLQVGEPKFVFEAKTLLKMELLVLSTLKWRMHAITPFSFIDNFLYKINGDKVPLKTSIYPSTQLILRISKEIDYLMFRPSEVAAAVAVSVKRETQTVDIEKSISVLTQHVNKDRILECVELFHEQSLMCWPLKPATTLPHSPICVLCPASFSYNSHDQTVGSCSTSSQDTTRTKRRKFNMSCKVQI